MAGHRLCRRPGPHCTMMTPPWGEPAVVHFHHATGDGTGETSASFAEYVDSTGTLHRIGSPIPYSVLGSLFSAGSDAAVVEAIHALRADG